MKVIKLFETDDIKWKLVYATHKVIEAEIVAGSLENEGIKVVTFNKRDSSYTTFGDIELYVPETEYELAMNILNGLDPAPQDMDRFGA